MTEFNGNPFNVPAFRRELGELLDEKLGPLVDKVNEHEAALNRARGARWAFGLIWSALLIAWEWAMHWNHK